MSPLAKKVEHAQDTLLAFHVFAAAFPLLNGSEFNELVADIKAHDLREPIVLYENQILDGRNRYRACLQLKRQPQFKEFNGDAAAARAFVFSQNIVRRHLKAKEKREAIAKLLKADPNKSDRQIAETIKASPTFVGKVRAEGEATGDVSTVDTRTDTKGPAKKSTKKADRKQPVRKPVETAQEERPDNKTTSSTSAMTETILSNPIARVWGCKATNAQRKEFALEYQNHIRGFVEEEQRRLPYAEQRRLAASEAERLQVRTRELEDEVRRCEIQIVGLESEIAELKAANNSSQSAAKHDDDLARLAPAPGDDGLDIPPWLRRTLP
jgi:ParB-like chromosome segregation protein Spo0J